MNKKIAALVFGGALVPLIISCAGSSSHQSTPYESPSTLAREVSGSSDPTTIQQGIGDTEQSAGFGTGNRTSDYNGLTIPANTVAAFAQGQAGYKTSGSNTMTFGQAYAALAATKALSLPTEPQLLTELNSEIAASYKLKSNPNSVVPILLSTDQASLPTEPATITDSTVLDPVQLLMLCVWLPTEPATPTLKAPDEAACAVAQRNLAVVKFCNAITTVFGLLPSQQADENLANAQANVNSLCDPQGGN